MSDLDRKVHTEQLSERDEVAPLDHPTHNGVEQEFKARGQPKVRDPGYSFRQLHSPLLNWLFMPTAQR